MTVREIPHGSRNTYLSRKCRCEPCVQAAQEYQREWYQKNAERRKAKASEWYLANKDAARVIPDDKHGTTSGYQYWKCRCDRCRSAVRVAKRKYTGSQPRRQESDIPHGTRAKYRRGCRCKPCRDASLEYGRRQYRRNPAAVRERNGRWIDANRDRYREWAASHYLAHREENRAKRREYARAHHAEALDRVRLRKARIKGVTVERVSRQRVWERDGGICYLCGDPAEPNNWHLEHKVPVSRGGAHSYANVAVSHPVCNLRKGTRVHVSASARPRSR